MGSPRTTLQPCEVLQPEVLRGFGCQLREDLCRANLQVRIGVAGPGFLSLAGIEKQSPRALVEEARMSPPASGCCLVS